MINDPFYKRHYVINGIAIVIVLVYIIRLFYLQVIDQSTKDQADNNALVKQTVYPSRGLMYDRNGELLVFNQPIYEITMVMRDMKEGWDTLSFCRCLQISKEEFDERLNDIKDKRKNRGYSRWTPQVFMSQLKKEDIATLQESLFLFPGVQIQKRTLRDYTYKAAAHVLGSVGEVNQNDIDRDNYYARGDYSGRDGLERTYEKQLRGEKGVEVLMRDSKGRMQGSYQNGELDRTAVAGTDLYTTLDIHLQMLAEELLAGKIGSAVAIEPRTGEILALVSNPAWNPKVLVGKERSRNYNELLQDPTKPLLNRATQATYSPGSTFKTIQALVCLHEKGITPNTMYPCSGKNSAPIKCTHNHGSPVTLGNAIEQSCNPYFWCAFRDVLQKDGYGKDNETFRHRYELWRDDVLSFGLGQRFQAHRQLNPQFLLFRSNETACFPEGYSTIDRFVLLLLNTIPFSLLKEPLSITTSVNEGHSINPPWMSVTLLGNITFVSLVFPSKVVFWFTELNAVHLDKSRVNDEGQAANAVLAESLVISGTVSVIVRQKSVIGLL